MVIYASSEVTAEPQQDEYDYLFTKEVPSPKAVRLKNGFHRITLEGLPLIDGVPGEPRLPGKPLYLLIPEDREIVHMKVITHGRTQLPGEYLIEPTQQPIPIGLGKDAKPTPPDRGIYGSDDPYPVRRSDGGSLQRKHGFPILILNVYPVEYLPRSRRVFAYKRIEILLKTKPMDAAKKKDMLPANLSSDAIQEIRSLVDNPQVLETYTGEGDSGAGAPLPGVESTVLLPGDYEYVIVTNEALESEFQPLIDQKIARGLTATSITTEYITTNYTGTETGDLADKIRQCIADAYTNWNTRWVLLGGDIEVVPKRGVYISAGGYTHNDMPTDLYYACLDGTWNGDGDTLWGEVNDGSNGQDIDLLAEVFVGRAPVSNVTEVQNFVAKTVLYETQEHPNKKTAIWLGENLDSSTYGSYSKIPIKNQCLPFDWNVVERYDSAGGWSGGTFVNDLNASPHIINHLGHASATYNARISSGNVAGLVNQFPYIMYSQGCDSGAFDRVDKCIAEEHVVAAHGALAVVMNARYGWYVPGGAPGCSHYYDREFWDAAFNEQKIHLGQTNQDSRDDNLFRVGSSYYRWIHFEVNLLGDPETPFQLPSLAVPAQIHGMVWNDENANGIKDTGESGSSGETVYVDKNANGICDSHEPTAITRADGRYTFTELAAGTYQVRIALQSTYWSYVAPPDGLHVVTVEEGEIKQGYDFLTHFTPPPPPAAPSNLSASAMAYDRIVMRWWDNSTNELYFRIERSLDGVNYSEVAIVGANQITYTDTGLRAVTTYHYRVRASNDGGESAYSNVSSATTPSEPIFITGIRPDSGEAGLGIRIAGSNFGSQDSSSMVVFEGDGQMAEAVLVRWKDAFVKCKVPQLPLGSYLVTVVTARGESNAAPFTITESSGGEDPVQVTITKLSRNGATPGTEIKISGTGFGKQDATSAAVLSGAGGSAPATVQVWKNSFIKCLVPELPAGEYAIKVITSEGESNKVQFTIL
jgi:hypothetical protein